MKETVAKRCSTRSFTDAQILGAIVEDILWAGVQAPSGSNAQNQRFYLYCARAGIANLADIRSPVIRGADFVVAVFIDTEHLHVPEGEETIWAFLNEQNAAASLMSMSLMATHHKVGNCWISLNKSMENTRLLHGSLADMFPSIDVNRYEPHGLLLLGVAKHTDADGFPGGDKSHGGRPVARRPVLEYMI